MGEALIVRRGGGGGDFSLELVERLYLDHLTQYSSALDPSAIYFFVLAYPEYDDYYDQYSAEPYLFVLKDGVIKAVSTYGSGMVSSGKISFDATTNKVVVKNAGWGYATLEIFKVI